MVGMCASSIRATTCAELLTATIDGGTTALSLVLIGHPIVARGHSTREVVRVVTRGPRERLGVAAHTSALERVTVCRWFAECGDGQRNTHDVATYGNLSLCSTWRTVRKGKTKRATC